jgi:thioesterase domain-containing protein/acyl carrier protein
LDTPGEPRLVAYVVARSAVAPPSVGELREHLRSRLPGYMIPSTFLLLEALPLTPNGKIDRKALPATDAATEVASKPAVAPRNPNEKRVMAIFEEVLKTRVASVEENFFDLGGHSILAARLMAVIEKGFGFRLPLATLLKNPTIEGIALILDDAAKRSAQPSWSPLVSIQAKGIRPPVFLVHGAGGNVLLYRELARNLGDDQPVYGLQAIGLDGQTTPLATVEEMAQAYLPHVRRIQPSGPYHLGGYCMGGMVAYEMARHLIEEGEQVALVALLDTYNMSTLPAAGGKAGSHLLQRFKFHLGNLARLRPGEIAGYLKEKTRIARDGELSNVLTNVFGSNQGPGGDGNSIAAVIPVQAANDCAAAIFRPRTLGGKLTLFAPEVNYDSHPDLEMGWGGLASEGIEVVKLAVNPHGMLMEPFVKQLAGELRRRLNGVAGGPAGAESKAVALRP